MKCKNSAEFTVKKLHVRCECHYFFNNKAVVLFDGHCASARVRRAKMPALRRPPKQRSSILIFPRSQPY